MKLAIWKTGHPIADTVADAFYSHATYKPQTNCDAQFFGGVPNAHIVYGILRGADKVIKGYSHTFNVDRGYWGANHFDGNYRISYKGTQPKWHDDIPKTDVDVRLEDWKDNKEGYILVCPPTDAVRDFFRLNVLSESTLWWASALIQLSPIRHYIREKGDDSPIDWSNIKGVLTFNSSVGWQALQRGIPCVSDPQHSLVGSYYKHELDKKGLEYNLDNVKLIPRGPLFQSMGAHQFTLMEIRQGKAWKLIEHYLAIS